MNAARHAAALAQIDAEIKMLQDSRKTATCGGMLDMINDAIDAARA